MALLRCLFVLSLLSTVVRAQGPILVGRRELFTDVPSLLEPHAAALGERVVKPGRERTILEGRLTRGQNEQTVRITAQLPNLVDLDGFMPGPPLRFDGSTRGRNSKANDELLEMFTADTAEGLLQASRTGAAIQLLGRRFPADANSDAPPDVLYDIYDSSADVPSNSDPLLRLKRYAFDSTTGLLAYTRYEDSTVTPPVDVEIRFGEWTVFQDSFYPRRIERRENGIVVFTFVAEAIQAGPKANPADFR